MPDAQKMQEYVQGVLKKIEKNDRGANPVEKRLGTKLKEAQDEATQVNEDMNKLRRQLQQGQKRLEEMGRTHLELVSKAAGFAESLISLQFGDEFDKEAEEQAKKEARSKGNGSKDDPSPKQAKKVKRKRTKAKLTKATRASA